MGPLRQLRIILCGLNAGGNRRGPCDRGTKYCIPMPRKGWSKYTPDELRKLQEAFSTMTLEEAAASVGMTRGSAYSALQSRGLMRKLLSASIEMKQMCMTDCELHYLAGLVDGEGTVTLRTINRGRSRNSSVKPSLIVSNTDKRMMDWITQRVPGAWLDTPRPTPHGTISYRCFIEGLGQLPLYRALQPLLVLKGDLLAVVIEWCETRLQQSRQDPLTTRQLEIISQIRERNMTPSRRLANGTYGTYLSTTSRREVASTE